MKQQMKTGKRVTTDQNGVEDGVGPPCDSQQGSRRRDSFFPHPSPSDRTADTSDSFGPTAPLVSGHSRSRRWPQTELCLTAWAGL